MLSPTPPTLEAVCKQALSLPCAPTLLPRLSAALRKEDCTVDDIEKIIQVDSALAAATLRLANSAFYGGISLDTLGEAIVRLGQKEIFRLAALALVNRWESSHGRGLRWEPGDFCRHTLCVAVSSEVLAELSERIEPQSAYTAGLVVDLGKLALAHSCAAFYPAVQFFLEKTGCSWEEAERSVLGYHHAEAGARLLRAWRFPEEFALAAEFQAQPELAPGNARQLLANLLAAKYLATTMGPGANEEDYLFNVHGDFLRSTGFTSELMEEAMPIVLERVSACLGENLTHGPIKF